jgi:hypothetical protein
MKNKAMLALRFLGKVVALPVWALVYLVLCVVALSRLLIGLAPKPINPQTAPSEDLEPYEPEVRR